MNKLDVVLRICEQSKFDLARRGQLKRICGSDRNLMVRKCLVSLLNSIKRTTFSMELTILDHNSSQQFKDDIKSIVSQHSIPFKLIELSAFDNSALRQFAYARYCEELVYIVEDDYLHCPEAIAEMLRCYSHNFHNLTNHKHLVINPFDDPIRYACEGGPLYPSFLFYSGTHYWRTVKHTTNTMFTHNSIVREHWHLFENLALNYPKVLEDDTINLMYDKVCCLNPIPSLAYHLAYAEPNKIKASHSDWQTLWKETDEGKYGHY